MKVLANSQDKAVGGIVRMMNTFLESVKEVDPAISFHLAVVSSSNKLKVEEEERFSKTLFDFKANHLVLSSDYYPHALQHSKTLRELKTELVRLIDFYTEVIEESKPDVVLINGTYYRPWALLQAVRRKGLPYVVYVHGSVIQESKGALDSTVSLLKDMESDFYDEKASYIFPSTIAMRSMIFSDRYDAGRFHVVHNALDRSFFTDKKTRPAKPFSVGFALRWEEVKNTQFILDFINYNSEAPDPYLIKVVADLNEEQRESYSNRHAEFLPPKTKSEMADFYSGADAIINPSFFETFGYVPAEAVAGGTPALVSASQGISELFLKCGLERMISDFSDISLVHKKLSSIIESGVSRAEIQCLRDELDPARFARKVLSILADSAKLKA